MKSRHLLLVFMSVVFLAACQSEIDDQPAAEVLEATPSPATTAEAAPSGGATANVIREKSAINFVGAKVTRDHQGKFNTFDGSIEYSGATPSKISFEIDLASVETDTPRLTEHLKSADFFDVARHPKATFVSTSITPAPAGSPAGATHVVTGTLDLHGAQKEVRFPVTATVTADGVRATSEFTINRHDWGISYRGAADDLIKDEVLMKLDLAFPPPPAA